MRKLRHNTIYFLILFICSNSIQAQVQKGLDIDGAAGASSFGHKISMPDSNTFASGAPQHNGLGFQRGYVRIFNWDGIGWTQKGNSIDGMVDEDQAGRGVHMPDVNTVAVGAPGNDDPGILAGQVRVFSWNGNTWMQKGLSLYGNAPEAEAGEDVFMPDSNTIAFGAPGSFSMNGEVSVYSWNGFSWMPKGSPIIGEQIGDGFGKSISMPDSNTIAIGAWQNSNHGHVRVYSWNGSTWQQRGSDIDGLTGGERFGTSVTMPDLNTIGVGAYLHNGGSTREGFNRIFSWNGNDWTQRGTDIVGDSSEDDCGFSVSMPDSNYIAIGYPQISADTMRGKAKVFEWDGVAWVQVGNTIIAEAADDGAGTSVNMPDRNTIAVGAINNDGAGSSSGHVRVFGLTLSTGVNKIADETSFQIHPNPSSTIVNITSQVDGNMVSDISIRDLSGRELKVIRRSANPLALDITSYENGIYLIQLTTARTSFAGKIIVQRD